MKIKKSANTKGPTPAPMSSGGAAIADRFRLDIPSGPSAKNGTVSKSSALFALIAGGIALFTAGVLTFLLYSHWDYLAQV